MVKFFFALFGYLVLIHSNALLAQQNDPIAGEVLEKAAAKYKAFKSFRVTYTRNIENAKGKVQSSEKAMAWISGNMFHIVSPESEIICNGTTIWNYSKEANEVNVYDYDAENDELNPTRIFNLYKTGYKYALAGEVLDGKTVLQNIEMEPEDRKKDIAKIRIVLQKNDKSIRRWILFQRGTNTKITFVITKFTPEPGDVNSSLFTFIKAKYPSVKVIDLR